MSVAENIHIARTKARQDHFPAWLENLIIVAILLVIAHTIIDDLSIVLNWSGRTRDIIMILGFTFDLFFTAEFVGRGIVSSRTTGFANYIKYERGWVDALSSVPLLLLVSGPAFVYYIIGAESDSAFVGFLSVLKTAKAIRVTRILRLIRIIKLFGKIQNTES